MLEHNNKRQVSRPMIYGRNHNKNISIVNFSCVFVANDFLHSFYLACNVSCSLLASIRHEFEWHVLHRFIVWLSGLTAAVHEGSHKDRKFKFRLGQNSNFGWVKLPVTHRNFPMVTQLCIKIIFYSKF